MDENIADNAGVRDALMAYQEYVKSHGKESLLVGFEKFTHEQLFTLAYANVRSYTSYVLIYFVKMPTLRKIV